MVKSGASRAEKTALKYDSYVNMLRCKQENAVTCLNFSKTAFTQYSVDQIIATVISTQNLVWGVAGRYSDLTKKLFYDGIDSFDDWLAAGISKDAYDKTKALLAEMKNFFYVCASPKSQLKAILTESPQLTQKPTGYMQSYAVSPYLNVSFLNESILAPSQINPSPVTALYAEICAHNVVLSKSPFLNPPIVSYNTWAIFAPLGNATVKFAAWGVKVTVQNPANAVFQAVKQTPILSSSGASVKAYNLESTISISVAKTP